MFPTGFGFPRRGSSDLEARVVPAITGLTYQGGTLAVVCDNANDTVTITATAAGALRVNGAAVPGNPTLKTASAITVNGGAGNDTIDLSALIATPMVITLVGGPGDDKLFGTKGGDRLFGQAGIDDLVGHDGNDSLSGGADNDSLEGRAGNDTLNGNDGDDVLNGGAGDDALAGGAGDDTYEFANNNPFVAGDGGTDTVTEAAAGGSDTIDFTDFDRGQAAAVRGVTFDLASAAGQVLDRDANNKPVFTVKLAAPAEVENVTGSEFDDTLFGNAGANVIRGLGGDDTIDGRAGADRLSGGDGKDTVTGGSGNDVMAGGSDDDVFPFSNYADTATIFGGDGADRIDVRQGKLNASQLQATGVEIYQVTGAGTELVIDADIDTAFVAVRQGGTATLAGGKLKASNGVRVGDKSTLGGSGTVEGDVTNVGVVSPGGPGKVGQITVTGAYQQTGAGKLAIDLGDAADATKFDQLSVGGKLTLAGALDVTPVAGYQRPVTTAVENKGKDKKPGTFEGKPEGTVFVAGGKKFGITYKTGDVVLNLVGRADAAPRAVGDTYVALRNTPLDNPAASVLANDTDPDGDPLTAALVDGPVHGQITLRPDGTFVYVPDPGYAGPDHFTYVASDGQGLSEVVVVNLTVV